MTEIKKLDITPLDEYRYLVDFKCQNARLSFKYLFSITVEESSQEWYWDASKGKSVKGYTTEHVTYHLSDTINKFKGDTTLTIQRGHIAWLVDWVFNGPGFKDFGVIIDMSDDERNRLGYNRSNPIELLPQWKEIFNNHPRGEYYVQAQYDAWDVISKYDNAAIELGTGLGKSEIILGTLQTFRQLLNDNESIVIAVPNNSIYDEIWDRTGKSHIEHTGVRKLLENCEDPSNGVYMINPVGYCNSSRLNDPEWIEAMKTVVMVIVDEAHRLSSDSYVHFMTKVCPNIRIGYAFSGTMNKFSPDVIHPNSTHLQNLAWENMQVVGHTGAVMISRKVVVDTRVFQFNREVSSRLDYDRLPEDSNWLYKLDLCVYSPQFIGVIHEAYTHLLSVDQASHSVLYIPLVTVESVHHVGDVARRKGYNVCVWNSGEVYVNGEYYGSGLEDVKRAHSQKLFQILITTVVSIEGVDLDEVSGIFSLLGSTSWSTIAQSLGRAARGKELVVYLLNDLGNPMVAKQSRERKKLILAEYNVLEYSKL